MAKQFYDRIAPTDLTGLVQAYQQNSGANSFLSPFIRGAGTEIPVKALSIMDYVGGMKAETPTETRVPALDKYTNYASKTFSLENVKNSFIGTISAITGIGFDTASDLTGVDNTIAPQDGETQSTGIYAAIENFIGRGAIIILGFVFVAAGLSMFKMAPAVVVKTVKGAV